MLPVYTTFAAGISFASRKWPGWLAPPLCMTAVMMALWISETRLQPDIALTWRVVTGEIGRDEYFRIRGLRDYGVVEFANGNLPEGSRILLGTYNENTAMLRHTSYLANCWLQDSFHYDSLEHLLSDIRRIGITHLMVVQTFPPWYENHIAWRRRVDVEHPVLMELADRFGKELFSEKNVSLFEITLAVDTGLDGE